jgi:aminoglycoside phosphotransferase family enzyme
VARLRAELRADADVLTALAPTRARAETLFARTQVAFARHEARLLARAAQGRLVEGHGDLRPEHVCMMRRPLVIDALEFDARLREVDPLDELAGLALECELAGAAWIGPRLIGGCAAVLGDAADPLLVALYTLKRAWLRARLAMAHLLDPHPRTPERWPALAGRHLAHAEEALRALEPMHLRTRAA